jgi:SP family myo-inositol transporter-like MFS transporter 13
MFHDVQSIRKSKTSEPEELEMQPLTTTDNDAGAPDEPLISHAERSSDDDGGDGDGNVSGDTSEQNAAQSYNSVFVYGLTVSAGVSGVLFGYDTGVISSTLVSINTDLSSRLLTSFDKGLITSSTSLFALIASPISGILADKYGRKRIILIADALFTLGALWQAVTSTVWGMILGRGIVGLAIGGASLIVPLYISELSPSHLRGRLVTVSITFVTGGQVVAYLIGWLFSTLPSGWRWMVGLGALPAIVQFFALIFMPETPRWLVQAEHEDEARKVLQKVFGKISASAEYVLRAIKNEILEEEEAKMQVKSSPSRTCLGPTLSSLLLNPPHARALTIACLLQGLQQLCGFNSLMYFSASIFSLLGFSSPILTSMSIASSNFIFTLAAFYLIDRVGRRRMLLYTVPMMAIALLLCAFAFHFVVLPQPPGTTGGDDDVLSPQSRLPAIAILISLVLYVSTYATGMGPVPCRFSVSAEVTGTS